MRINSIQFLRALAVLLVVHTHALDIQMMFSVSHQQHFFFLDNFGAIGADLFFVISGFIISYVANKYTGVKQGIVFLKKRFLRINPVYYVATLIALIVFFIYYDQFPWQDMQLRLIDTLVMIPILPSQKMLYPVVVVGWTLSFEWWFYILFFVVISVEWLGKTWSLAMLIWLLVSLGYILALTDFRLLFFTNPIMLEFLMGVAIYGIFNNFVVRSSIAYLLLLLGIAGYVLNIIYGYGAISELANILVDGGGLKRSLLWGLPSVGIAAGCIFLEKSNRFLLLWNNRIILLIGAASYSIYLLHFSTFYLLIYLYNRVPFFLNPDLAVVVHMLIAIGGGLLFYRHVEVPLMNYFHPSLKRIRDGL